MAEPAWARPPFTTRTHAINPETGEFTSLDQESDMTDHRAEAERLLPESRSEEAAQTHALLAIHATLAEIRDRLPERVEAKVAPFDPDVIAANVESIKHEIETPMRGHGECCDPAPADVDPDEALGALIWDRIWGPSWRFASEVNRAAYRNLARAVREHIEQEPDDALADATRQRDALRDCVDELLRERQGYFIRQRDEWQARHEALREDLEDAYLATPRDSSAGTQLDSILARDDERVRDEPA